MARPRYNGINVAYAGYCECPTQLPFWKGTHLNGTAGLDKGGADLIADGRIKVKSGAEPVEFLDDSVILSDGTELPADVVILASVT